MRNGACFILEIYTEIYMKKIATHQPYTLRVGAGDTEGPAFNAAKI